MPNAALCAVRKDLQDGPRREVVSDGIVEVGVSTPPAFPASDVAAAATALETTAADTVGAAAAHARSAGSAPGPPNVGVEGCPQDPKASGLDVLVGAVDIVGAVDVDIRGNRAGPAAAGDDSSAQRPPTPIGLTSDLGALSEEASGSGRADSNGGYEDGTAHRAPPRAFAGHEPNTGMESAGAAAAGTLPGFSVMPHSVGPDDTAFSTPGTAANSSRERRFDGGSVAPATPPPPPPPPPPPQPLPLGPTARDTYATLTGAALRAAPAAAFPGLAPKKIVHYDDEGFRLSPIPPPEPANPAKPNSAKRKKAAKKSKALKTKAAIKTKVINTKKNTAKAKSGTHRVRRGPAGQSHFKGVCLTPAGTWRAVIYVDRRQKYLGVFDNEFDAARAYDAAAILHFPDATPPLNNPDDVERQLNAISATDGKPFATAGAPGLPEFKPTPLRLEGGYGSGTLA